MGDELIARREGEPLETFRRRELTARVTLAYADDPANPVKRVFRRLGEDVSMQVGDGEPIPFSTERVCACREAKVPGGDVHSKAAKNIFDKFRKRMVRVRTMEKLEIVYAVRFGNHFPMEIDSLHATREGAEARCSELGYPMEDWEVAVIKVLGAKQKEIHIPIAGGSSHGKRMGFATPPLAVMELYCDGGLMDDEPVSPTIEREHYTLCYVLTEDLVGISGRLKLKGGE